MHAHFSEIMVEILNGPMLKNQPYLDPGSGSFILQILLAGLVGIGFAFRSYWGKLLGFFRKDSGEEASEEEQPADEK